MSSRLQDRIIQYIPTSICNKQASIKILPKRKWKKKPKHLNFSIRTCTK